MRDGDKVIGFLHISAGSAHAEEALTDALPALVEFAEIAGTLIGPGVAARTEVADVQRRIRTVIEEHRFTTVFQPIVDLVSDRVVGHEALTRFADGVAPDVRFAEAEAADVGHDLEIATLRNALAEARQLPADAWLNLNVSPQLVMSPPDLAVLLREFRRDVVLEVTEHAAVDDYAAFRAAVARLGPSVRIAVDDAGAGFASLRHILELRPAFVKLDRALISGIDTDNARRALVAGMQHFAAGARCRLIAEGVETVFERGALRELEIGLGQGYLLGHPAPIGNIVDNPSR